MHDVDPAEQHRLLSDYIPIFMGRKHTVILYTYFQHKFLLQQIFIMVSKQLLTLKIVRDFNFVLTADPDTVKYMIWK